jgi:predicted GNAT family N-acyltransferase
LSKDLQNKILFQQVAELLQNARHQVLRTVNSTMVCTYFEIGRMIVEEEQSGKDRAEYGKQILKGLSQQLTNEFGKGFSVENLDRMRKFYQTYSISSTLSTIFNIQKKQTLSAEFIKLDCQTLSSFFTLFFLNAN